MVLVVDKSPRAIYLLVGVDQEVDLVCYSWLKYRFDEVIITNYNVKLVF